MKIFLDSDFRDFYDYWFGAKSSAAPRGFSLIFHRNMRDGISKIAQFEMLEKTGFQVPKYGRIRKSTFESDFPGELVVLYTDLYAHASEGKGLMKKAEAACFSGDLVSEFIPTTSNPTEESISYRMLAIGSRVFWLRYSSNEWASNRCDVQIVTAEDQIPAATSAAVLRNASNGFNFTALTKFPMFAIDFVCRYNPDPEAKREFYAVDFNSAPGLSRTPIEDMFSGMGIYNLIDEYISNHLR